MLHFYLLSNCFEILYKAHGSITSLLWFVQNFKFSKELVKWNGYNEQVFRDKDGFQRDFLHCNSSNKGLVLRKIFLRSILSFDVYELFSFDRRNSYHLNSITFGSIWKLWFCKAKCENVFYLSFWCMFGVTSPHLVGIDFGIMFITHWKT